MSHSASRDARQFFNQVSEVFFRKNLEQIEERESDLSNFYFEMVRANEVVSKEHDSSKQDTLRCELACLRFSARGFSEVKFETKEGRLVMYVDGREYRPDYDNF